MLMIVGRLAFAAVLPLLASTYAFAQDEATPARLEDGAGKQIGRAEITTSSSRYGLSFRLWLDNGAKLRILYPTDEARRDAPAKFTFREFKVDPRNPKTRGDEIGSGVATVEVAKLSGDGNTESFSGSMQLTTKAVGDNDVPVNEPAQRFKIVLQ